MLFRSAQQRLDITKFSGKFSRFDQRLPYTFNATGKTQAMLQTLLTSKYDLYRLMTFESWKANGHQQLTKELLAKMGFSYTGHADQVKCHSCQLEIGSWTAEMNPRDEHIKRSPDCQFISNQRELFSESGTAFDWIPFLLHVTDLSFLLSSQIVRWHLRQLKPHRLLRQRRSIEVPSTIAQVLLWCRQSQVS